MNEPTPVTYDLELLAQSERTWSRSPGLRFIYEQLYRRARRLGVAGSALEIGAGIGKGKAFWPELRTSDLIKTKYVDEAIDAYALTGTWRNILAVDVLHHLNRPMAFFECASRALEPGGRLILVEPAATPLGGLLYRLCHHEPCRLEGLAPPFEFSTGSGGMFANMAMAKALFGPHREWSIARLEAIGLRLADEVHHDFIAYFSTGGFSKRLPTPVPIVRLLSKCENHLPAPVMRVLATRMTLALERAGL